MSEVIWVETLGPNGREMIPVEVKEEIEVASKPEEIGEEPEEVIEVASVVEEATPIIETAAPVEEVPAPKKRSRKKKESE